MSKSDKKRPPLRIALPSKGRLREKTFEFFEACGLGIKVFGGGREYTGRLRGIEESEIFFYRPDEIPDKLERGEVHLGVTGLDLVEEHAKRLEAVPALEKLGFGFADLVVAVPRSWIDLATMDDLEDVAAEIRRQSNRNMRVATKYVNLTRRFFSEHGITHFRIVESLGATEGAPAAGIADIIVDITSTGATIAQNHLKVINGGRILSSQASLFASLTAQWSQRTLLDAKHILTMLESRIQAKGQQVLNFTGALKQFQALAACKLETAESFFRNLSQIANRNPDNCDQKADALQAYACHCPSEELFHVTEEMHRLGFRNIFATRPEYIFEESNAGFSLLARKLKQ